jgi:hypothetical protein
MPITAAEYCMNVCGAKCCYVKGTACPCLRGTKCAIYERRFADGAPDFADVGLVQIRGKLMRYTCGKIARVLELKILSPEIREQCCYHDPTLLEKDYGSETRS